MMKVIAITGAVLAAVSLSSCGLRGDLERPDPLFGNPAPDAPEAEMPKEKTTTPGVIPPVTEPVPPASPRTEGSYIDPATGATVWVRNELGGEKPRALPTDPVGEGTLPPVDQ